MGRSLSILGVISILAMGPFSTAVGASSNPPTPPMSIRVLSVVPRTVTREGRLVRVRVRYSGITMDPLHIGRRPVSGHGHMQMYLDLIPAAAYQRALVNDVVANATTSTFSLALTGRWRRPARGHHTFLIALARNDNVLYRVKPARFSLTVK